MASSYRTERSSAMSAAEYEVASDMFRVPARIEDADQVFINVLTPA